MTSTESTTDSRAEPATNQTPTRPIALIPERATPDGPVTTRRLRRTAAGYGALALAGAVLARRSKTTRAANLATGLVAPGAGYLTAGKPGRFLATQAGFAGALGLWLGSGNVLAPIGVWAGTALAGLRHDVVRPRAAKAVQASAVAALLAGTRLRKRAFHKGVHLRNQRNAYLRELGASDRSPRSVPAAPVTQAPEVPELTEDQLAIARFALDRALQPVAEFNGYDKIEQFQTSSIRYQVTVNGSALTALQYAHTPAFHGYLSQAQRNTIAKWQERICWAFWSKESLWGHLRYNPDPIPRDDIMVSGWLGFLIAGYTTTTLDQRYTAPGSISFRHPRGMRYDYDLHSLTEVLARNFTASPYGLFPCEPNWIYALCNGFGVLPLPIHDRLYDTDYARRVLPAFRKGFENEFLTVDGRTIGLRSKWTGLTVPAMTSVLSDASVIWQLYPIFPDIARRQWAILREEFISLDADGGLNAKLAGWDNIDTGNYRRSNVSALLWLQAAATELGDTEVARAAATTIGRDAEPVTQDGVKRYAAVSAQSNLGLLLAATGRPDAHYDRVNTGLPKPWATGPILEQAPYPDVLVARAVTDGVALDLVLRPGTVPGRRRLGLTRLRPGGRYRVTGAVEREITADQLGRTTLHVDLDQRRAIAVQPATQTR